MEQSLFFANWRDRVVYSANGPRPQVLYEDGSMKVLVAGLEPGSGIPAHPENASVYHFLEGEGKMFVGERAFSVSAGSTVVVPAGAARGMQASTRLAFLAVRIV
jgi:mannose-6-phosphate isomerase-like protein (cupin superfamily)